MIVRKFLLFFLLLFAAINVFGESLETRCQNMLTDADLGITSRLAWYYCGKDDVLDASQNPIFGKCLKKTKEWKASFSRCFDETLLKNMKDPVFYNCLEANKVNKKIDDPILRCVFGDLQNASKNSAYPGCLKLSEEFNFSWEDCIKENVLEASKNQNFSKCLESISRTAEKGVRPLDYCTNKPSIAATQDLRFPGCLKAFAHITNFNESSRNCTEETILEASKDSAFPRCLEIVHYYVREDAWKSSFLCSDKKILKASRDLRFPKCIEAAGFPPFAVYDCTREDILEAAQDLAFPKCIDTYKKLGEIEGLMAPFYCHSKEALKASKGSAFLGCLQSYQKAKMDIIILQRSHELCTDKKILAASQYLMFSGCLELFTKLGVTEAESSEACSNNDILGLVKNTAFEKCLSANKLAGKKISEAITTCQKELEPGMKMDDGKRETGEKTVDPKGKNAPAVKNK